MDVKVSNINKNENIFTPVTESDSKGEANLSKHNFEEKDKKKKRHAFSSKKEGLRINDYDLNILETYAYKELEDTILRYEYKINHLEQKIANINNEINTLENLNSDIQLGDLRFKRDLLELELKNLYKKYEHLSITAGMSSKFSVLIKMFKNRNFIISDIKYVFDFIMQKISKKYRETFKVKTSLNSLKEIVSILNELIDMKSPYGEKESKYEKLTALLNQANFLQTKILLKK